MLKRIFLDDRLILAVIVLNAITIFANGFVDQAAPISRWLETIDQLCTMVFVAEASVKIVVWKPLRYFKDGWNLFDFILVVVAVPSLLSWLGITSGYALNYLLIFRVLRVFKFFRVIRFIPNVNKLIEGVLRALRASILIVFAFFVCNFIIALLSYSFFNEASPEYFGDPLRAFYSTFKVFTIEGWYEIPDELAEDMAPTAAFFTRIYFVLLLFGGGIFGLSLINSIFVESMLEENYEHGEEDRANIQKEIAELKAMIKALSERK